MARKLIVEVVGDTRGLERSYRRSTQATRRFSRDIERTTRGAIVASGAFRSLGRSVAYASSAFLGGAGFVAVIKSTVAAAEESQAVLAQTRVAVQNAGLSWKQYGEAIQETALQEEKLTAFTDEELLKSFSTLLRRTDDVRKAFRLNALAADVARGRQIDLQTASLLVIRASLGMAGSLRRVGIAAKTGATGTQLLTQLQKKYGGAAAAYGRTAQGAMDRFRAAIDNVQEAIGNELLPVLTRLLTRAAEWLDNANNQRRVVKVLSDGFKILRDGIQAATDVLRPLARAVSDLAGRLGGWKTAIELAIGAWVGFKLAGVTSATAVLVANVAAAEGVAAAWRTALISTGWGAVAVAAGAAAAYIITHWDKVKVYFKEFWLGLKYQANRAALDIVEPFSHLPSFLGGWARSAKDAILANLEGIRQDIHQLGLETGFALGDGVIEGLQQWATGNRDAALQALADAGFTTDVLTGKKTTSFKTGKKAITPGGLGGYPAAKPARKTAVETWLDKFEKVLRRYELALSKAELTKTLQDDLAILKQEEAAIREQLRLHKGNIDLQEKLVGVMGKRRQLEEQITQAQKERRAARQFAVLGLGPTGEERIPGLANLRRRWQQLSQSIRGTELDTRSRRSLLDRIRKALDFKSLEPDVRSKIRDLFDGIADELKQGGESIATKFKPIRTDAFIKSLGLDLTPAQIRRLRLGLSQLGPGMTMPGARTPAFAGAGAVVINGGVVVTGVQDPGGFADALHKRAKARPPSRRGAR